MRVVQLGGPRGLLVVVVLSRLWAWVVEQGYAPGSGVQIVTVAVWLSVWMEDHGLGSSAVVDDAMLDELVGGYAAGVLGCATVVGRIPAVRRFFTALGNRCPRMAALPGSVWVEAELDAWGCW